MDQINYLDYLRDKNIDIAYTNPFLFKYFFEEKLGPFSHEDEFSTVLNNNVVSYNKNKIILSTTLKKRPSDQYFTTYLEIKNNRENTQETDSINELNPQGETGYLNIKRINLKSKPEEILKSFKKLNTNSFLLSLSGKAKGPKDLARNKNKYY